MTPEQLKRANELEKQIRNLEWQIENIQRISKEEEEIEGDELLNRFYLTAGSKGGTWLPKKTGKKALLETLEYSSNLLKQLQEEFNAL